MTGLGSPVASAATSTTEATSTATVANVTIARAGRAQRVPHGRKVRIGGHVEPRMGGRAVVLRRAVRGRPYRDVARTWTRADGSYRFRVRARRSSAYRAVVQPSVAAAAGAQRPVSGTRRIRVVARIAGSVTRHVYGGEAVRVRGRLLPALRGRRVHVQLAAGRGWTTVKRVRTRRGGRFRASWRPSGAGRYRLRVRFAGDGAAAGDRDRLARVHSYRAGHASWYGPGFYGNRTACGGTLGTGTLGVAHKWLPCGTRVTFRYRGRSVTVPVIDRGPYVAGREWDLTGATKARLGFPSTGTVWSTL
ncbi:MAG: septal ring lytic transglycosylase RlpA family protein [Thermoleophilaceae bacterium]